MIAIIYLIQIVLSLLLIFITRKLYEYGNYKKEIFDIKDKIKIPVIAYLLFSIANIIPGLGLGIDIWLIGVIIKSLIEEDVYYKPGKITKFLFKQI